MRSDTIDQSLARLYGYQASMTIVFKRSLRIVFLLAAFSCCPASHASGLPVPNDLSSEARVAHQKRVPILVLFKEESCTYCETALEDFLLPMQRDPEFNDKVILRQIDTDSEDALIDFGGKATTYKKFSSEHKVSVVPNVMLFDSEGRVLTHIEGLLTVDFYYGFLVDAINASLEKIRTSKH
jgi:thioredoxin-related protein